MLGGTKEKELGVPGGAIYRTLHSNLNSKNLSERSSVREKDFTTIPSFGTLPTSPLGTLFVGG